MYSFRLKMLPQNFSKNSFGKGFFFLISRDSVLEYTRDSIRISFGTSRELSLESLICSGIDSIEYSSKNSSKISSRNFYKKLNSVLKRCFKIFQKWLQKFKELIPSELPLNFCQRTPLEISTEIRPGNH